MNEATVLEIARGAVEVTLLTAGPLLLVGTAVGLIVALVQALTTVQEMTLSFAPKIVAVFLAMLLFLPFMLTTLIDFTRTLFESVAHGG
jgi:flagellar biosynthetic protein FliQ